MANLTGGTDNIYLTFKKPYLTLLANKIHNDEKVKFEGNVSQQVNKTPDVKNFLKAVKDGNERMVKTVLKSGNSFLPIFNGYRWTQIDKSQFSQKGGDTKKQELGSLLAIQKGIENNGYTDKSKFFKLYREELFSVYPEMNEQWEETFFQQQLTVYREVGPTKFNHYSRDGGFMDYITGIAKNNYGITQKDTWNPADVWLVSDYQQVKRILDNAIKDDSTSIQEFNEILRKMFRDKKIIGISLKLISGTTAKWEVINLEDSDLFDEKEYQFSFSSSELDLQLKTNSKEFNNTDSKIFIEGKRKVKFQIRQNSAGFNNLKIEGTDIGASSARLGKVPLDMATQVFKAYGLESMRWRRWQNYPTNADEYNDERKTHEKRFSELKRRNKVSFGNVTNQNKFSENIIAVFNEKPDIANSKLMQLDFLNEIFSLTGDKLDSLLTNLAFLAQKKGDVFGPFAKLY